MTEDTVRVMQDVVQKVTPAVTEGLQSGRPFRVELNFGKKGEVEGKKTLSI